MKQSGFTLLEVLVAMMVLSIGLLGLAGLMAASMRNNESAYHSTQATWLAYDILDRMRANRTGALANAYNGATLGSPATCSATAATGSITAQDIGNWKNAIACALPAGDGAIAVGTSGPDRVTVTVQWNDSRADSVSTARQIIVESQL
ncbi:MAG: type IV pilus modification protein PilV [Thiobacillus sp.]|nr:type IV pilus modification protein PilV [Thiobacillus sp.]